MISCKGGYTVSVCNGCIVTCEHGGNRVPARYTKLFAPHEKDLNSHRGYDPGALELARAVAGALGAPFLYSTTTRLLIELNRSANHKGLFSKVTNKLDQDEQEWLIQNYYMPYQNRVEKAVCDLCGGNRNVLHLSIHSFAPIMKGERRNADIGLLYDPRRPMEKKFCHAWRDVLREQWGQYRVRMNYPYRGRADGFTTQLRKRFPVKAYAGVEVEMNQKHHRSSRRDWNAFKFVVVNSLLRTLQHAAC